ILKSGQNSNVRLRPLNTLRAKVSNRLDEYPELPKPIRRPAPWRLGWKLNSPGTPSSLCDLLGRQAFGHTGSTGNLLWIDPATSGFCILLTTAERARAPWRLVHLSNVVAASFV